jgi:chorismate synthase
MNFAYDPNASLARHTHVVRPFVVCQTIARKQKTVNRDNEEIDLLARGRHDPCVVPRAVPMAEAMIALVLADHLMIHYAQCELLGRGDAAGQDEQVRTQFAHN